MIANRLLNWPIGFASALLMSALALPSPAYALRPIHAWRVDPRRQFVNVDAPFVYPTEIWEALSREIERTTALFLNV